ncbi:hypothetical protein XA68_15024 [Ophiocordyceps unilateralis]|uniref:Uncharacterized protein n=1 Tax=Ophiocordyceps unilateralis TaxID=268505 RepID=A0A2A9P9H3_OPHUN|nr:hypothetical protein XA68_15024 [Ophiocordyceps unilateralis]
MYWSNGSNCFRRDTCLECGFTEGHRPWPRKFREWPWFSERFLRWNDTWTKIGNLQPGQCAQLGPRSIWSLLCPLYMTFPAGGFQLASMLSIQPDPCRRLGAIRATCTYRTGGHHTARRRGRVHKQHS